jgi:hypothetical protein
MFRRSVAVLGLVALIAGYARAVGDGAELLPDIPLGTSGVRLSLVADVGSSPVTDVASAGDGTGRLFLVSPNGVIRILRDGLLNPTPFLNLPASPPDRAMTGLVFHPQYASNGKLYLITGEATPNPFTPHYSAPQTDTSSAFDNVLYELEVDASDPNAADLASQRELLRLHDPHRMHNMNDLAFGSDGYLYVAQGDGGDTRTGTPTHYETNAQQTTNPFGKILRIDVDGLGPNGRYAIPPDNPFASGADGNVPEIFAWGVRNPWRISADRLTGEIYTAVNGDFTIEYVLRVELGKNYGWAVKEGGFLWDAVTGNASVDPSPDPNFTPPLAQYDHNGTAAFGSVIGGFVYRGARMPDLYGEYLFIDWLAAKLVAMDPASGALELVAVDPGGVQLATTREISWGEDEVGELYLGRSNGELYKLGPAVLCGDLTGDDDLQADDVGPIRDQLADPVGQPLSPGEQSRCTVIGSPGSCDLLDAVVIRRAVDGLQPGVSPLCAAAGG